MSDHDHETIPVDPRIAAAAEEGCEESRLLINRRAFMGVSASLFSWAFMTRPEEASANTSASEPRFIIVLLRGGLDGLHVSVPMDDPNYRRVRASLALNTDTMLPLTPNFRLNANMPKFKALFDAGQATLIHAIAPPLQNRSHFDCMKNLETGQGGGTQDHLEGWLNRLFIHLPTDDKIKLAKPLQVGKQMPLILQGDSPVVSWTPSTGWTSPNRVREQLLALYDNSDRALYEHLDLAQKWAQSNEADVNVYSPGTITQLRSAFRGAGRLMNQENAPRISVIDVEGWDTHSNQLDSLNKSLANLDSAMDDLKVACGNAWNKTVVVCVTEFGRTAAANGQNGTEHGIGTVAFVLGGSVNGGRVVARWPGLSTATRDIVATHDTRALFKGILIDHMKIDSALLDARVFPNSSSVRPMENLIRS